MAKTGFVKTSILGLAAIVSAAVALPSNGQAAELVFYMSEACGVCDQWKEEVGGIYPKTDEARTLPLRAVSVHDEPPADLAFVKGVRYTPTFVVVEDGKEVGRMVGYISDYFFWHQVSDFITKVDAIKSADVAACGGDAASAQGAC